MYILIETSDRNHYIGFDKKTGGDYALIFRDSDNRSSQITSIKIKIIVNEYLLG